MGTMWRKELETSQRFSQYQDVWNVQCRRCIIFETFRYKCRHFTFHSSKSSLGKESILFSTRDLMVLHGWANTFNWRKGECSYFPQISRPVVPVPNKRTAGLYIFPTVWGYNLIILLFFNISIFPQVRPYRGGPDKCYTGFKNRQICVSGKPEKHAQPYLQVYHIFGQLLKPLSFDPDLRLIPGLRGSKPLGMWAGLRPATEHADYQISFRLEKQNI